MEIVDRSGSSPGPKKEKQSGHRAPWCRFFVRFLTGVTLVGVVAAGASACTPPKDPEKLVIIAGQREGTPPLFTQSGSSSSMALPSLASALKERLSKSVEVSVIPVDGDPKASAALKLDVDESNPTNVETSIRRNTPRLAAAVLAAKSRVPEANQLAALGLAGRALAGVSGATVVIADSGIPTAGAMLAQNGLIGPATDVSRIVGQLKESGSVPPLAGVSIHWFGIGQTAGPQATPPGWAQSKLRDLWSQIISAGGGNVTFHDDPFPPGSGVPDLPPVTPVLFDESVAEPVALVVPAERVAFKENDSVFAHKDAAKAALDAVADQLAGRPHGTLYVTGCTALPPGADPQRMADVATDRAAAVGRELGARGVGNIQTRGYGPHCPGRIPDIGPDGAQLPDAQAQNRKVLITSVDIQPVEAK